MVAEAKNRIIVESLLNGKRMPVSATAKISSLEDIAVYTTGGDIPLKEILKRIAGQTQGGSTGSPKATDQEIRRYFETVVPDYDRDRVYISDIRKILIWYNLLQEKELLDFTEEEVSEGSEAPEGSDVSGAEGVPGEAGTGDEEQ